MSSPDRRGGPSSSGRGKGRGDGQSRAGGSGRGGKGGGSQGRGSGRGRPGGGGSKGGQGAKGGGRTSGGPPRRYSSDKPQRREDDGSIPGNREWGGLARKGVLRANHDERIQDERKAARPEEPLDPEAEAKRVERERRRAERMDRQEDLRRQARSAVERASQAQPSRPTPRAPAAKRALERRDLPSGPARNEDEVVALNRLLGPAEAKKQLRKLRTAAESFEAERYADARKSLKSISELAPSVPEIRELYGLTLYRMGQYKAAAVQLEEFRVLAGSVDQNPVLADCYRAQQRWADVAELWAELAAVSPSADIVNEGRIVMAGSLADQGDLDGAVRMLEKGWKRPARPQDHHLRRAYALADLYDRAGRTPRARELFGWIARHDPDLADVKARLRALS